MEKVYPPNKFTCSNPIALKEYFSQFSQDLMMRLPKHSKKSKLQTGRQHVKNLLKEIGIHDQVKQKDLLHLCREFDPGANRKRQKKIKKAPPLQLLDKPKQFYTIDATRKCREKFKGLFDGELDETNNYWSELEPQKSANTNIDLGEEFAVSVRIYYPFDSDIAPNSFLKLRFCQEIVLLGSNTLADLREIISCRADFGLCVEVEHPHVELPARPTAKEKYPSGFIFIDSVFYNDMRNESAIDYSDVIRKWAEHSKMETLTAGNMETTKISDLSPRFGYPYVYQHQGDCEHVLTFASAWILTSRDPLNTSDYPYIKSLQLLRTRNCILCYKATAEWICYNSDRIPHAEAFVCEKCLLSYCYDEHGEKIGSFKLFPYFDESCPIETEEIIDVVDEEESTELELTLKTD